MHWKMWLIPAAVLIGAFIIGSYGLFLLTVILTVVLGVSEFYNYRRRKKTGSSS